MKYTVPHYEKYKTIEKNETHPKLE